MELVFVNQNKQKRAQIILDIILGIRVPKTEFEEEQKAKFGGFLAEANIESKSKNALAVIYEKLGGLTRTQAEQKEAEKKKEEIKKRGRKKMIE